MESASHEGVGPTQFDRVGNVHLAISYKFTRSDGAKVSTILERGKAHIMEERGEGPEQSIVMLERSQLTDAERALIQEVRAIENSIVENPRNERVTHIGTLLDGTGFATIDPDGLGRLYDGSPPKGWPVDLQGSGSENNS